MGSLGVGKTLLACGVAQALRDEGEGQPVSLGRILGRQRWRAKLGTTDLVLVDRPGRGYGDDYTPWLLDAEVGRAVVGYS